MRIFIAVNLPYDVKRKLGYISRELQAVSLKGRFVQEELLHLTLEFMGSLAEEDLMRLIAVTDWLIFEPFTVKLGTAGSFPGRSGRTWWIGVEESPQLIDLQVDLHRLLEDAGFSLEKRAFHPHITLGRAVRLDQDQAFPDQAGQQELQFEVSEIHIMRSETSGGVLSYTSCHRIPAGGPSMDTAPFAGEDV